MRCLALAQSWHAAGGQAIFVMSSESAALHDRLQAEGVQTSYLSVQAGSAQDALRTAELAFQTDTKWVVVDGYHFDSDYQQYLKNSGARVLLIDDCGRAGQCSADIVLNQNIHANAGLYGMKQSYTRLLLGTSYVLLRKEFLKWRDWKRDIPDSAVNLLVTFGGGDLHNLTLKTLRALEKNATDNLQVVVVIGGSNTYHAQLLAAVDELPLKIDVRNNITDMAEVMAWADVAVSAAGSTCWELAFMGLPSLLIVAAENQRAVAEGLFAAGAAENLGWHEDITSHAISKALYGLCESFERRFNMSKNGRKVVDGKGSARVKESLLQKEVMLRRVRRDDCELLWEWENEPNVRSASFFSEPITWEQHVRWFESKIADENCFIFIAINEQKVPIGRVRFEREGKEAVISVGIDKNFRGMHYGSRLIEMASRKLFEISDVCQINAYIKVDNAQSVRAFLNAGYKERHKVKMNGNLAFQLTFPNQTQDECSSKNK